MKVERWAPFLVFAMRTWLSLGDKLPIDEHTGDSFETWTNYSKLSNVSTYVADIQLRQGLCLLVFCSH